MYDVNSEEFKYHFHRSKLKLKQWEDRFKSENGRIPTKEDMVQSGAKIKYYYRIYWKLKTLLLEETILGGSKTSTTVESDGLRHYKSDSALEERKNSTEEKSAAHESKNVLKEHTNVVREKPSGLGKSHASADVKPKGKNAVEDDEIPKSKARAWGVHLDKVDVEKNNLRNWKVSEKLFEGSKFKKRNPMKVLKKSSRLTTSEERSDSFLSSTCASDASFTSTEAPNSVDSFPPEFSPCPDAQDEMPTSEQCSVQSDCSPKIKALIMSKTELSPLFAKNPDRVPVLTESKTVQNDPIGLIQKFALEPNRNCRASRSIDVGWVQRCCKGSDEPDRKASNDSGFGSKERGVFGGASDVADKEETDANASGVDMDDDIIGDSDNERDADDRLSFLPVKRKCEDANVSANVSGTRIDASASVVATPSASADAPATHVNKKMKLYEFPSPVKTESKRAIAGMQRLQKKLEEGTINDNFVKLNMEKKTYVKYRNKFNFVKHKVTKWKKLKKNIEEEENVGTVRCYTCGDIGHYARHCRSMLDKTIPEGDYLDEEADSTLPTLEEAESMAREEDGAKKYDLQTILSEIKVETEETTCTGVTALYDPKDNRSLIGTPSEVSDALAKFGHAKFRPGQEQAVMRILSGLPTLVTIATGGGKSLCYQLPAYLYATKTKAITLVVSPLVSLMEDQVSQSSSFFKMGCLHNNQTPKQRETVVEDAKKGKLFALLVSPEAVVGGDCSSGLCNILKSLPPIAFACIDEVHCVSQWSHNFRPSYLMLTKVLKEKLGVRTILGLTATATKSTIDGIRRELEITDDDGVIKDVPLPDNLCLSASEDESKDSALIELLVSPRFRDANAILIYCTRRDDCERLAALIRTRLNNRANPVQSVPRTGASWNAESYHAGMSAARRKQVQKAFMKGNLRIVVATIAFGMGINKRDIRSVIHYNIPKDFESYVQEVGRAGRDGMLAHCHLFLDENLRDLNELKRHIYSNSVDRYVLRKLLQRVFVECKCKGTGNACPGHEVAFDCSETIRALDLPEENIYTLLCYMELHPKRYVKVLTPGFVKCKIQSYGGVKAVSVAAKTCPPLAVACAMNPKAFQENGSSLTFNVVDLANAISWPSGVVKRRLKNVEWIKGKDEKWRKSGIVVEFFDLGFRLVSRGDLTDQELDEALCYLMHCVQTQEKKSCEQLNLVYSAFKHFAASSSAECTEDYSKEKSEGLKNAIRKYFETEELPDEIPLVPFEAEDIDEDEVASDVRSLLYSYKDVSFKNGRIVARIFHGIPSPNFPALVWHKCRHWRQHVDKDFNKICKIATREILRFK